MSTYDGAYSAKKYPSSQPYWVYPCTCREEYEEKTKLTQLVTGATKEINVILRKRRGNVCEKRSGLV